LILSKAKLALVFNIVPGLLTGEEKKQTAITGLLSIIFQAI